MRRAIKLVFREQRVSCPHCHAELIYNSLSKTIRLADRTCLTCRRVRPYYIPRSLGECLDCAPTYAGLRRAA